VIDNWPSRVITTRKIRSRIYIHYGVGNASFYLSHTCHRKNVSGIFLSSRLRSVLRNPKNVVKVCTTISQIAIFNVSFRTPVILEESKETKKASMPSGRCLPVWLIIFFNTGYRRTPSHSRLKCVNLLEIDKNLFFELKCRCVQIFSFY